MRVLFIGDMVGKPGRAMVAQALPELRRELGPFDFVLANGENAAAGRGLTKKVMDELFRMGIDGLTSGNHIWDKREFYEILDQEERVVRPANYPEGCPGRGGMILRKGEHSLAVLNLQGRVFMPVIDCPFRCVDRLLESVEDHPILVDFHAEATSEKRVLAAYLDGRISAFLGTHTHVQTADEEVLPGGTAYISDVGMTGAFTSAIGMTLDSVMPRFLTGLPSRFEVATEDVRLNAVVIDIDESTGVALDIRRVLARDGQWG
ncbi:MAG: TIGR00282 family metallophosphoesterase [Dethiosulfovibrio peptidovorans]|nr:MAG: TIGR00282 family metallophosphoesterase [Dethiosulfovibrio peptidovorans]